MQIPHYSNQPLQSLSRFVDLDVFVPKLTGSNQGCHWFRHEGDRKWVSPVCPGISSWNLWILAGFLWSSDRWCWMRRAITSSSSCIVENLTSYLGPSFNRRNFIEWLDHSRLVSRSNLSTTRALVISFACLNGSWQGSRYVRVQPFPLICWPRHCFRLMIVTQRTGALMHASSVTNMMDYPHLLATGRKYLHYVAVLEPIVSHSTSHNGKHVCVHAIGLLLHFELMTILAAVRCPTNVGSCAHFIWEMVVYKNAARYVPLYLPEGITWRIVRPLIMMMRNICARHELTPVVPRVTFRSTEHHYALESVLLIGKSLIILQIAELIWEF